MFIPGTRKLAAKYRRSARHKVTPVEKAFIKQMVEDHPNNPPSENAIARITGRRKGVIKRLIQQAKDSLNLEAEHYVKTHKQVMDTALANGDAKSLEVAARAAQWGMENIAHEGARILEKAPDSNTGGVKVLIGVKVGGLNEAKQLTE